MIVWLGVAAAGAFGAASRFGIDLWLTRRVTSRWPAGTTVVNLTGALALGMLIGMTTPAAATGRLLAGAAFLGSYTTFSTWMVETVLLIEQGRTRAAMASLATVFGGVMLAALGIFSGALLTA